MRSMEGKRVLFFANRLFGIEQVIKETLEKKGAIVEYYDERPANTFFVKALIRINRNLLGFYVDRYHQNIIARTAAKKYDYIFFIKGESFSYKNLSHLLSSHPEAHSIVYHWDSIANNNNALNLLGLFDSKYSFDRIDCKKLNIEFLPLFYYDDYRKIKENKDRSCTDLLFVGTVHSNRYRIIKEVIRQFEDMGCKCNVYFYFQGKLMFYKYRITHKEAWKINKEEVHYEPISRSRLLELYKDSRIIIDVSHPKQTGLTLRCMETLGAGKKLITTNRDIVNYDFYNPDNILVINGDDIEIPMDFIKSEYKPIAEEVYEKYSLSHWVDTLFDVKK